MITFWKELLIDSWRFIRENFVTIAIIYFLWYGLYDWLLYGYTLYLAQGSLESYSQFSDAMVQIQENNKRVVLIARSLSFGYVAYEIWVYLILLWKEKLDSLSKKDYFAQSIGKFIQNNWRVIFIAVLIESFANSSIGLVILLYAVVVIFIMPFFLISAVDGKKGVKQSLNFNFSLLKNNKTNLLIYFVVLIGSSFLLRYYDNLIFLIMKWLPDWINIILSIIIYSIVGLLVETCFTVLMVKLYQKAKAKYELRISDQKN